MSWNNLKKNEFPYSEIENSNKENFFKWTKENGITKWCDNCNENVKRFLISGYTGTGYNENIEYTGIGCNECLDKGAPYLDHHRYFKNAKTGQVWLVSQPYFQKEDVEEVCMQWAKNNGLKCEVYSNEKSWYNAKSTCLIIYTYQK